MQLRGCLTVERKTSGALASVFMGPEGVRAGWRIAVFLACLAVPLFAISSVFAVILHHTGYRLAARPFELSPLFVLGNELTLLLPILIATGVMAFLENTPFTAYGLAGARKFARLGWGLAGGVAALSLLIFIIIMTGHGAAAGGGLNLAGDLRFGAEWFGVCLLIGFTEEFALRGYLLSTLERRAGFPVAALVTSLLFAILHGPNPGETFVGIVQVFAAGLLFCLAIRLTGSLWWPIGFHAGWDYAENFIFGTHDSGNVCVGTLLSVTPRGNIWLSGGLTGPEGSIFGFVVVALAAALVWAAYSPRQPG